MSDIDYSEAIKSHKGVTTSDGIDCGNIIGERDDSIIVDREGFREHVYVIPKSKIEAFDGSIITLKVAESELKSFEEKRQAESGSRDTLSDTSGQVKDTITDTAGQVKDTITDTISGTVGKVKDFVTGDNNKNS
jgi:hypothetical protein